MTASMPPNPGRLVGAVVGVDQAPAHPVADLPHSANPAAAPPNVALFTGSLEEATMSVLALGILRTWGVRSRSSNSLDTLATTCTPAFGKYSSRPFMHCWAASMLR